MFASCASTEYAEAGAAQSAAPITIAIVVGAARTLPFPPRGRAAHVDVDERRMRGSRRVIAHATLQHPVLRLLQQRFDLVVQELGVAGVDDAVAVEIGHAIPALRIDVD